MGAEKIMSLLNAGVFNPTIRYYKYVMDSKTNNCAKCLHFAGEIFAENDPPEALFAPASELRLLFCRGR